MRFYYAQLDEDNVCIGISDLSGEVNQPDMIRIDSYDMSLLRKKYNFDTGEWDDVPPKPEPEPKPLSEQQQAVLDTVVNTEYLVCLADLGI